MRPSSHLVPLITLYWLTSNVYPIDTQILITNFSETYLFLDLTLAQVLIGAILTNLSQLFHTPTHAPNTPLNAPAPAIALLHYLATLLANLSFSKLRAVHILLSRLSQPLLTLFLRCFLRHESFTTSSILGFVLILLGIFRFSADTTQLSFFLPVFLSTVLFSIRDVYLKPAQRDDCVDGKRSDPVSAIHPFRTVQQSALPLAVFASLCKWSLHGGSIPVIPYLLRNACLLAVYHSCSLLLLPRLDPVTHAIIATLKRFSAVLLAVMVCITPVSMARLGGLAMAFAGFALFVYGQGRHRLSAGTIAYAVVSGVLVFAVFLGAGGFAGAGAGGIHKMFKRGTGSVERVNSGGVVVIPVNDYRTSRRSLRYDRYREAVKHEGGNVGNLVWKYAAHECLPDFGDVVTCDDGIMDCVENARSRGMGHIIYRPVANILNPDAHGVFQQSIHGMEENGMKMMMVGMGVQIAFRLQSDDPEFNASARITTSSEDFRHTENTKKFLKGMEEIGGEMLLRGDFSLNVTRKGGFSRAHSLGCPSLWMNDDIHLGRTLEKKYSEIAGRQGDKTLKIAVNVKNMSPGEMEKQIIHFRDNYPNSRFYIQGRGDVRLLSGLEVPYERTRFFTNVEDWIEDLREMDVSYGVRIHGNMIGIAAGLPVLVVASDWRVLELVQRMKIPFVTSYDPAFERDVDVAGIIERMPRFDGEEFDRNRCQIAKAYIEVFGQYGFGVKSHVRQVSKLC